MQINPTFSKSEFLSSYWQKKPCVVKNAITLTESFPDGDILAGLACEEFIESRLVLSNEQQDEWNCEFGSFDESRFTQLNPKNWTLLVQNVDDFIPEVKQLNDAFDFLPKWRLDDVMFSYATLGGGVGPHFDYYDVFLIQTSGSREWLIGQECNSHSTLRVHPDLKLLKTFNQVERHVLNPGDMIYIPSGIAHWGTALSNDCITASIGFRAPAYSELLSAAMHKLSNNFSPDQRYKDSRIEQDKYLISDSIKKQLTVMLENLNNEELIEELAHQFSLQVTELRHPELVEMGDLESLNINLKSLKKDSNSRFAYRQKNESGILYVNGEAFETDLRSAKSICHSEFSKILDLNLLDILISQGVIINS